MLYSTYIVVEYNILAPLSIWISSQGVRGKMLYSTYIVVEYNILPPALHLDL